MAEQSNLWRLYVTTPIYYVNDRPHIGHSYTTILADVICRYYRLFGHEVRMQTGTDEHGQKVQQSAAHRGVSPQQQCDEFSERFKEMWRKLEIHPDHEFIRTTQADHKQTVQEILQRLYDQGDIYKDTYSGWYNVSEEMFISESDVTEEGKESGRIVQVTEDNYFFRLTKYRDWLNQYLEENPAFIFPNTRLNEVKGLLREGLTDLCISRPKSRLEWGIEIPFDTDYVTYVWFDALVNYISGLGWPDGEAQKKWWTTEGPPADKRGREVFHLIGKDILKPHAVFWPIMLHAAGIPLPTKLIVHGWWTRGGQKESKTVTKALAAQAPVRHIEQLIEEYGVDAIRYYLMREMTIGQDQDYTEEMIVQRLNSDLANDLGNLVNRVTNLVRQYFDSKVPQRAEYKRISQTEIETYLSKGHDEDLGVKSELLSARQEPNRALEKIRSFVSKTNSYLTEVEPWSKAKKGDLETAGTALHIALKAIHRAAVLLHPVMPRKMEELLAQIGCSVEKDGVFLKAELAREFPSPGAPVPGGPPLFPRLDWAEISKKIEVPVTTTETTPAPEADNTITIDEFKKVDLRVAEVIEAERVPKADKLLKLQIRIGDEVRQIIAGVAEFYTPEQMVGKKLIVVANLKPATIRGVESRGMLLAAREGGSLQLLTLDGDQVGSGSPVG